MNNLLVSLFFCLLYISCQQSDKGVKIEYDKKGNLQSIKRYNEKGENDGLTILFYPNGNIKRQMHFENGEANGHAFYFYESGAIKSHRYWRNDRLNGFVTDYYDDTIGLIKNVVLYNDGNVEIVRKGDTAIKIE